MIGPLDAPQKIRYLDVSWITTMMLHYLHILSENSFISQLTQLSVNFLIRASCRFSSCWRTLLPRAKANLFVSNRINRINLSLSLSAPSSLPPPAKGNQSRKTRRFKTRKFETCFAQLQISRPTARRAQARISRT